MSKVQLTVSDAVKFLLSEGVTTPNDIYQVIEGADYCVDSDAVIIDTEIWYATSEGDDTVDIEANCGENAAEQYISGGDWGEDESDIHVDVWQIGFNDDGEEVSCNKQRHTITVNKGGPQKDEQDDCEIIHEVANEYTTDYLAVRPSSRRHSSYDGRKQFCTWTNNGGYNGAHDRMDGDGKWREHYDYPEDITPLEAIEWIVKNNGDTVEEAIDTLCSYSDYSPNDLIAEAGEEVTEDVYKLTVCDKVYWIAVDYRDTYYADSQEDAEEHFKSE